MCFVYFPLPLSHTHSSGPWLSCVITVSCLLNHSYQYTNILSGFWYFPHRDTPFSSSDVLLRLLLTSLLPFATTFLPRLETHTATTWRHFFIPPPIDAWTLAPPSMAAALVLSLVSATTVISAAASTGCQSVLTTLHISSVFAIINHSAWSKQSCIWVSETVLLWLPFFLSYQLFLLYSEDLFSCLSCLKKLPSRLSLRQCLLCAQFFLLRRVTHN